MIDSKSPYVILLVFASTFFAKDFLVAQSKDAKWNKEEITMAIDSISNKLKVNYVFPHVADSMTQALTNNLDAGKYDDIEDPRALARLLTSELQFVSKDKHLQVVFNPEIIARENSMTDTDRLQEEAEWLTTLVKNLKRDNFGFRELKILDGNIGYLDLHEFSDPKFCGEALVAAMQFLSSSQALIIDLRENEGGHPNMVQLLASYFFTSEPVHLANHYNRPKNELTQSWTLPYVPGKRLPDLPLYILTSSSTFSAAEGFSYFLKHLDRASIIGVQTAGGAHLTGSVIATDNFYVRIPQGRPTSPVTDSNWEGIGVIPDIDVGENDALETAYKMALEMAKENK